MKTRVIKKSEIDVARRALESGGIVAFPTDTVYGLGVAYDNEKAINQLRFVKKRPEDKPFALMVSSMEMIKELAILKPRDLKLIQKFMPGDVTFVFRKKVSVSEGYFKAAKTIAFRMPQDAFVLNLIAQLNKPLLVPSANVSNEKPCVSSEEVLSVFRDKIEVVVEGESLQQCASTIVDASSDELSIIRQGKMQLSEIKGDLMEIALACDHGAYEHKETLKKHLENKGYLVKDFGGYSVEAVDYPDTVYPACEYVVKNPGCLGIVMCGTGIGASIVANKVKGIRCALVYDEEIAKITRLHNNTNVLASGGRVVSVKKMLSIADAWLETSFSEDNRHQRRIDKISKIEEEQV